MVRNDISAADLGNGYYRNPIIKGNNSDPAVIRVGGDYYMVNMSGKLLPGMPVWHSRDLVNWELVCKAADFSSSVDLWAPDIAFHDGRFYIYCISGDNVLWVMTSDRIEGPWSSPHKMMHMQGGFIDPAHCVDENGKRFLSLSRGYIMPISDDGLSPAGDPVKVYDGWQFPEEWATEGFCLESDKIIKKDGWYHLVVAEGGTWGPATSHMIVSARSRSLLGPWENSPHNPILRNESRENTWHSLGHGALVDTPDGEWYVLFHGLKKGYPTLGRQTLMLPVEWTPDGWFRIPEGIRPDQDLPMPKTRGIRHELALDDDFPGPGLRPIWSFYGDRDPAGVSLDGDGVLLQGRGTTADEAVKLTCNTVDEAWTVEVELSLSGSAEGGMLLYYNPRCFCGAGFDGTSIKSYKWAKPSNVPNEAESLAATRVLHIRMSSTHHEVSFFCSNDGNTWRKLPETIETSGYHHNSFGEFTSLKFCLYAAGEGQVRYRHFRYRKTG